MIQDEEPVMFKMFEKPKCKPWDIVKGRRKQCCHGLGKHTDYCMEGVKTIYIPKVGSVTLQEVIDETG